MLCDLSPKLLVPLDIAISVFFNVNTYSSGMFYLVRLILVLYFSQDANQLRNNFCSTCTILFQTNGKLSVPT